MTYITCRGISERTKKYYNMNKKNGKTSEDKKESIREVKQKKIYITKL